ncbi:LIM and senescent cell antigen-like-containing domain protein 1 [Lampetra fluviatilis]
MWASSLGYRESQWQCWKDQALRLQNQEDHQLVGPPLVGGLELSGAGGAGSTCTRCGGALGSGERVRVTGTGAQFHPACFVCAQCFQRLPKGLFFEFDGRMYCERDFMVLYAPCCTLCGEFVIGRVIRAMNSAWHPACFRCDACGAQLVGSGFVRSADRHLCHACHALLVSRGVGPGWRCRRCRLPIEGGAPLVVGGDAFHPEHFSCDSCGRELGEDAAEEEGRLLCRPCRDRAGRTCGACRRPLEGRGVHAMGRDWHVEHFVCAKCEKPFLGHRHMERNGLAYCETHYNQLFGDICFHCNRVVEGDVLSALNKTWCVSCFCCSACHAKLSAKTRFVEVDHRPVCKRCFSRLPQELRRRLAARGRETRAQRGARP